MYTVEEFDKEKTKIVKYIVYKKRTEKEVYNKFNNIIEDTLLRDIIEYLKENGYINDCEYIEKAIKEYMILKNMSKKEIEYKLYSKGLSKGIVEEYFNSNKEELDEYEKNSAKRIISKKIKDIDIQNIKQYLTKKGYSSNSIKEAILELENEE